MVVAVVMVAVVATVVVVEGTTALARARARVVVRANSHSGGGYEIRCEMLFLESVPSIEGRASPRYFSRASPSHI